jgi:hypothetical protein
MLRLSVRQAFFVLILFVVASCGGAGGCSGCSGCGMTPLPNGFPQASVIPNAASVRVTRPGLDFIGTNLGPIASKLIGGGNGGVITFNVPNAKTTIAIVNIEICPSPVSAGNCVADINIGGAKLHVDAVTPHAIQISGTVPVKIPDIPVHTSLGGLDVEIGSGGCGSIDFADVPITATLPLVGETLSPRDGYTKIDTANAVITPTISPNIVNLCNNTVLDFIIGLFKSFVVGQITAPLTNTLKAQLQSQLCTKPDPTMTPTCPVGSQPDMMNAMCVFTSDPTTCVPTLLGLQGHMDLGSLVSKLSPGTTGAVDLVLAGGGDGDPAPGCQPNQTWDPTNGCQNNPNEMDGYTPNGLTLGMLGGMLPNPQTACAPPAVNAIPQNIPIPDEMTRDGVQPWPAGDTGPDLGVALAGRFLNYAGTSAYNSGFLCLGVSTENFGAINTGFLSVVIPSLKDLTFEPGKRSSPAPVALLTRPQKPPVIAIGGGTDVAKDPLLKVTLPQFAIDFYAWSYDRYVRVFTYTADLTVPVNLQTGKDPKTNPNGGILPVIGNVAAANGVVTNSDLVWEDPQVLGAALSSLLSGIVGQFLGNGFSPINLSSALASFGVNLSIPANGFRKLTKGTDDFVALFADLTTTTAMFVPRVSTQARIVSQDVHPEAMALNTADPAKFPKLRVALSSPEDDGSGAVEYTWWVDDQPHAAWTTARDVEVTGQYLFLQGKHTLHASARRVGQPDSEGDTPASVPFLVDVLAPYVWLDGTNEGDVAVSSYDFVSDAAALRARFRSTDSAGTIGPWSEWAPLSSVSSVPARSASSVTVQVMDEAGNVGESTQLVRGRPDPTLAAASSACGCSTPGADPRNGGLLASLAVLGGLAALVRRARRTAGGTGGTQLRANTVVLAALGVVASSTQGCSCGGSSNHNTPPSKTECGFDCNEACGPANLQGLIGAYTSVAVAADGTTWVAGYNDADVTNGLLYGDLVVGKYDSGKQAVQWQTVDGLPPARTDGSCPPNAPDTWRNGETDPGPDVGLWTSLQLDASGNPMVSYYDATNGALKFASSPDGGKTWNVHTVMQAAQSDIGRYSKMIVLEGKPTIAFLVEEPGAAGWARSRVVLATANIAVPQVMTDWSFQNTVVDEQTPCRAEFCDMGDVCVQSTMICQPTATGCTPADCGASTAGVGSTPQACVTVMGKATCEAIDDSTHVDSYPDTAGDYVTLANGSKGLGIVVYDRTRGNLVGVANQSGNWAAQILDGQTGANTSTMRMDTGDVGVGASLAIADNGDWHVSYVNGWTESLEYVMVPGGDLTKPQSPEVVDNGLSLDGMPNTDGQHLVGDDSSISVDGSGTVRIVYQDATAGTLREATGTLGATGKHTWSVKALAQPNRFAGFFPHYVAEVQQVANWFRATDHSQTPPVVSGDVAFVQP